MSRPIVFGVVFGILFALDLITHRTPQAESRKRAIVWSAIWIAAGLGFAVFVWASAGGEKSAEYLAAYTIEKTLSLDNLFVFLLVFNSLKMSPGEQHKALVW